MEKNRFTICRDILRKLEETRQVYIVDHDIPLSISKTLFWMLDSRRREEAARLGVPEEQYEFEDLMGKFLGLTSSPKTSEVEMFTFKLYSKEDFERAKRQLKGWGIPFKEYPQDDEYWIKVYYGRRFDAEKALTGAGILFATE